MFSDHTNYTFNEIYIFTIFFPTASKTEFDLVNRLLQNYNPDVRPVDNVTEKVVVKIGLGLNQIIDMVSYDCIYSCLN